MSKCTYCKEAHQNENTGCRNSGNCNSGDYNSGNRNSGDYNSGNRNSGNRNSGNRNSGNRNSGDCNSGYCNSGDYNSGYCNSGDYNSGYCNSGIFNTNEPKMRSFNKDCDLTYTEFRKKFGYNDISLPVTGWINYSEMTAAEKKEKSGAEQMGGYLKTLSYKEAWAKAWSEAPKETKDWYKSLPNFDVEIFYEITGIKISGDGKKEELMKKADELISKANELKQEAERL